MFNKKVIAFIIYGTIVKNDVKHHPLYLKKKEIDHIMERMV